MVKLLDADLIETGVGQGDQVKYYENVRDLVNEIRTYLNGDRLFSGNPAMAIDTNFDVQSAAACVVSIDGVLATIAAATCDTGTAATFPTTTWGIFLVSAVAAGTLTATWDTNSSAGYATEALAIAALPDAPALGAPIAYVTVEAHATGTFLAGTDALETGTGGDVANATNYYNVAVTKEITNSTALKLTAG